MRLQAILAAVCASFILLAPAPAAAWGADGHRYVGAVGQQLLSDNARDQVKALLAYDAPGDQELAYAAVWPDCLRAVVERKGGFAYVDNPQYPDEVCKFFETKDRAAMEAFAGRNWTNCEYAGKHEKCHLAFHFANVAIQRGAYDQAFQGASRTDIVSTLNEAIRLLRCDPAAQTCSSAAPYDMTRRDALFLVAHMIGDLHQPLHVGSVWLQRDGTLMDPDDTTDDDGFRHTTGGNNLTFIGLRGRATNLHSDWDGVSPPYKRAPTGAMLDLARQVAPSTLPLEQRPAAWASESIAKSRSAFVNVSFQPKTARYWGAEFADHDLYVRQQNALKDEQITLAGARLAEVLNTVWP